ncbi:hypothetical protein B566_EDAN003061 [Ephemera danica]|nr:hypothetical protein B566_EDAN003061 [Ephemera danica]
MPRMSVTGSYLPYSRKISALLFDDKHNPDPLWTALFMQFGQFISHDMSQAPSAHYGNEGIQCCTPDGGDTLPGPYLHHACYPILIPPDDDFFSQYGQRCMNFVRTMTVAHPDCRLGPAEQMNAVTHFLDLSQVYGSSESTARSEHGYECDVKCPRGACYLAGDTRVNQNLGLTSLHTVFLRMHNWLAAGLARINPHWDDEYLYQESRRILIAIYQRIVYYEYLPIALGWDYCVERNLVNPGGAYGGGVDYDDKVNPSVANEHATCAFRYSHSTVNSHSE